MIKKKKCRLSLKPFDENKDNNSEKNAGCTKKCGLGPVRTIFLIICICVFLFSVYKIISIIIENKQTREEYSQIKDMFYEMQNENAVLNNSSNADENSIENKDGINDNDEPNNDIQNEQDNNGENNDEANKNDTNIDENDEETNQDKTDNDETDKENEDNNANDEADQDGINENNKNTDEIIQDETDSNKGVIADVKNGEIILDKFNVLLEINEDVVGWIRVPGTKIDYPVLQGKDNEYYLKHTIYHEEKLSASIFMDFWNDITKEDDNIILYGHNMKDRSMFAELDAYVDDKIRESFYKENKYIYFDTLYNEMKWEVFSAYVEKIGGFFYIITNFKNGSEFLEYLNTVKSKTIIYNSKSVDVTIDDRLLTLSTCNHWFLNSRTVIQAKLVKEE